METAPECTDIDFRCPWTQNGDNRHRLLLRAGHKRASERSAEQSDEHAPLHLPSIARRLRNEAAKAPAPRRGWHGRRRGGRPDGSAGEAPSTAAARVTGGALLA